MNQYYLNKNVTCKTQGVNSREPKAGCRRLETTNRQPVTGSQSPVTNDQQPTISGQTPVTSNPQPAPGFTLLEVLIAVAIMAIVLVSVYRMHSQTLSMTTATRFYTQAPMLAQSKMAQLETAPADSISGDSGDFGDKFPGYRWSVSTEEVSSEALGEVADDLKRIDVTVSLYESEYEYSIRAYRLVRE